MINPKKKLLEEIIPTLIGCTVGAVMVVVGGYLIKHHFDIGDYVSLYVKDKPMTVVNRTIGDKQITLRQGENLCVKMMGADKDVFVKDELYIGDKLYDDPLRETSDRWLSTISTRVIPTNNIEPGEYLLKYIGTDSRGHKKTDTAKLKILPAA